MNTNDIDIAEPFSQKSRLIITCAKFVSPYLSQEIAQLGFPVCAASYTYVETVGTMSDCMLLNLYLLTGHRVLYLLRVFKAKTPTQLYEGIKDINWEKYIHEDGYFSVSSYTDNIHIKDTRFTNVRCKDAIVDRMNSIFGRRPDSGVMRNKAVLFIHWKNDDVSVYIDTSGETIAKHGYRKMPWEAPLQESLAAAVIMATQWDRKSHFINPMCGSGTLAIEAALIAQHRAPGIFRNNFGFMHIKGFNETAWMQLRREAFGKKVNIYGMRIIATDINRKAIQAAIRNAAAAGVDQLIEFKQCSFEKTEIPPGGGIIVLNPEYGHRLGQEKHLKNVYKAIGNFFKQKCTGYTGYVFTGNTALAKFIGLRTRRKIQFYNAKIECRLLEYNMYEGSKKK